VNKCTYLIATKLEKTKLYGILSPSVAGATAVGAPNNPAKLFDFNMSPNTAIKETIVPPTRNRKMSCVMKLFSRHSKLAGHDANSFLFTLNSARITAP